MEERKKLTVLIDADNISPALCEALIQEVAKYGVASVKRAYGDWTTPQLTSWKPMLHEYAISPMQQFSYTTGKNSTDSSMIIDAMDLLYTDKFDGFCLVTSDSDFTKLATRIREAGLVVYGFGEKKTPGSLQAACDKFVFLEALVLPSSDSDADKGKKVASKERKTKKQLNQDTKLISLLRGAVEATSDDEGWANIAAVGAHIANQSSFDSRNYGYRKLSALIETTELFDIEKRNPRGKNTYDLYLRDKRFAE
ncbi:NYN domain-containing protein [Marinicella gelatinilytica]|uniref:NYN domain-containing protein n=1 Tax=Marinicella gelatinilytica TaxID=2996017 RepID=UPI002260B41E|nr:NYN domain-containing protein [Marinicella gelatinilytica]MCX7544714.1 NYN domain-containing protein [Marinicella gelatinilytica]